MAEQELQLPPDTLDKLKTAREKLDKLQSLVNRAKSAGFPTTDNEKKISEMKAQILKIRQGFFPNETI